MASLAFWKAVVQDRSNFLERVIALLEENAIRYCVIGGVAVNAYAEAAVTRDLDLIVATVQFSRARQLVAAEFDVHQVDDAVELSDPGSQLRVRFRDGLRFASIIERAQRREVMDLPLWVADPVDALHERVDVALGPRGLSRGIALYDIARLIESIPDLGALLPATLLTELTWGVAV